MDSHKPLGSSEPYNSHSHPTRNGQPAQPRNNASNENPLSGTQTSNLASAIYDWPFASIYTASPQQTDPTISFHVHPGTQKVSVDSSATLHDTYGSGTDSNRSMSSFAKPFYDANIPFGTWPQSDVNSFSTSNKDGLDYNEQDLEKLAEENNQIPRRRRGYLANLIDLYNYYDNASDNTLVSKKRDAVTRAANLRSRLVDPLAYDDDQLIDRDDPLVTGVRKKCLDDMDDVDQSARRQLSYRERREEQQRVRIEFNVCCKHNKYKYLASLLMYISFQLSRFVKSF
jgi:hypothetical protein